MCHNIMSGKRAFFVRRILACKIWVWDSLSCGREVQAWQDNYRQDRHKEAEGLLNVVAAEDDLSSVAKPLVH